MNHLKLAFALLVASVGCASKQPFDGTCQCCTKIKTSATDLVDVASDGTAIYARSKTGAISTVATDGTVMQLVPSSSSMAGIPDGVAYAVAGPDAVEVHELVGSTDRLLGSIVGASAYDVQGNETDVYLLGTLDSTTLWRFSRATANASPAVVATGEETPTHLALGASFAAWSTRSGMVEITGIPGPSIPTTAAVSSMDDVAYVGDTLFGISRSGLPDPHYRMYTLTSIEPPGVTLYASGISGGGILSPVGTSDRLFWAEEYDAEDFPSGTYAAHLLHASTVDRDTVDVCDSWVSPVLAVTPTKIYGLEDPVVPPGELVGYTFDTIDVIDR